MYAIDSFIRFWIKDCLQIKELVLKKCTIIYGKNSLPIFHELKKFEIKDSFIRNQEFQWKPTSEKLESLTLLNNDLYGCL